MVVVVVVEVVDDRATVVRVELFARGVVVAVPVPRGGAVVLRGEVVPVVPRAGAVVVVGGVVVVVVAVELLFTMFSNGFELSMVSDSERDVLVVFPLVSVATAETVQVPSASSGSTQPDVVGDAV